MKSSFFQCFVYFVSVFHFLITVWVIRFVAPSYAIKTLDVQRFARLKKRQLVRSIIQYDLISDLILQFDPEGTPEHPLKTYCYLCVENLELSPHMFILTILIFWISIPCIFYPFNHHYILFSASFLLRMGYEICTINGYGNQYSCYVMIFLWGICSLLSFAFFKELQTVFVTLPGPDEYGEEYLFLIVLVNLFILGYSPLKQRKVK